MIRVDVWNENQMVEIHHLNLPEVTHYFTGNFWDAHPGCHGAYQVNGVTIDDFHGYWGLASQLATAIGTEVEVIKHPDRWWDNISITSEGSIDIPDYSNE